jgi:hypothetical protein
MVERFNGNFWRWFATVTFGLLLSFSAYYVRANDRRWEEYERWKHHHEEFSRDSMVEVQSRLARIEEIQKLILERVK